MNDPNGLCRYQGRYHLFFQYHPYSLFWGPMHWGHAVSDDLLRWEYLPCALAPDTPADEKGCFSGSAVPLENDLMLFYTGVPDAQRQTQCMARGDGIDFVKASANPVLAPEQLPADYSRQDFRDPKVWRTADGFRMAVGSRHREHSGTVLLLSSENGLRWTLRGPLESSRMINGRMWECPDFFALDGRQLLVVSPQEMQENELFHQGYNAICLIGDYDPAGPSFRTESVQPVDQGLDFYAPQTVLAPDGRRLLIGWMENWAVCKRTPRTHPWYGQMSLPREISLRNGRLLQQPIRELEGYWGEEIRAADTLTSEPSAYPGLQGRMLDMNIECEPVDTPCEALTIRLAADAEHETALICDFTRHELVFDRRKSGGVPEEAALHRVPVPELSPTLSLRIVMDRESVEIFLNGGARALSYRVYTPPSAEGLSFAAQGAIRAAICAHRL